MLTWRLVRFEDLSPREVHDIFQLRMAVFVVEQNCPFQDVDGADPACLHLLGRREGELVAYARLVPPGTKFAEPSIGRVITAGSVRRSGVGRELMRRAVEHAQRHWPGKDIRIGAQQYLQRFYGEFGFATVSAPYDEDGIPHVQMLRSASAVAESGAQEIGQ